jgi:hypothetical protein
MATNPTKSIPEKIYELHRINYKLLLCHQSEIQYLKNQKKNGTSDVDTVYINNLYNHYIIKGLCKKQYKNK